MSYASAEPENCAPQSTAVLKAAIQMSNGELPEHEGVGDDNEAPRVSLRNPGKRVCISDKQDFF